MNLRIISALLLAPVLLFGAGCTHDREALRPQPAAPESTPPPPPAAPSAPEAAEPAPAPVPPPTAAPREAAAPAAPATAVPGDASAARTGSTPSQGSVKPQAPARKPPTGSAAPAPAPAAPANVPAPAPAPALDLNDLEQRLRDTHAIGVFTKLSLKNQVDDLLGQFRIYHRGRTPPTLQQLRQAYEVLLLKVVTLLQDNDPSLAGAVSSSREAIWSVLKDPAKFAKLSA